MLHILHTLTCILAGIGCTLVTNDAWAWINEGRGLHPALALATILLCLSVAALSAVFLPRSTLNPKD